MDDHAPQPPLRERAMDTVTDVGRTTTELSAALGDAVARLIAASSGPGARIALLACLPP